MIPKSMIIPDSMKDSTEMTLGGSAYVWKSTHKGSTVAVKVFRMCQTSDLDAILSVSDPLVSLHISE